MEVGRMEAVLAGRDGLKPGVNRRIEGSRGERSAETGDLAAAWLVAAGSAVRAADR